MVARQALKLVNGSASMILVKPIAVMAARVLGPGPTRLKLVRLAHNLRPWADEDKTPFQPPGRAA